MPSKIRAVERLLQLYEATDKPNEAAKWRKDPEDRKAEKQPEKKP